MINTDLFYHIPLTVRWDGWESDTLRLRKEHWHVFVNEKTRSFHRDDKEIDVALRDPEEKIVIAGLLRIPLRFLFGGGSSDRLDYLEHLCRAGLKMRMFKRDDRIETYHVDYTTVGAWQELLPSDGLISYPKDHQMRFGDLPIFKQQEAPKEIYIPSNSVSECLNRILQLQYPEQMKLRDREKNLTKVPVAQAKIYSLAA